MPASKRLITNVASTRRNPILADIFGRLGYMERQGSGFRKINEAYHQAVNFRKELEPQFYSDAHEFRVTLYNLNYNVPIKETSSETEDVSVKVAIEVAIDSLIASKRTKEKAESIFAQMGTEHVFGRTDISAVTNDSVTAAGNLINKLKSAGLIEAVSGQGKGKYKFVRK